MTAVERFWSKVMIDESPLVCWPWLAARGGAGYGHAVYEGKHDGAHRVAYEQVHGPIPGKLQIDHLCRNKICCNPSHLEAVTCRENLRRRPPFAHYNARKTTCRLGHPFDRVISTSGERYCGACHYQNHLRRKRRLAAATAVRT